MKPSYKSVPWNEEEEDEGLFVGQSLLGKRQSIDTEQVQTLSPKKRVKSIHWVCNVCTEDNTGDTCEFCGSKRSDNKSTTVCKECFSVVDSIESCSNCLQLQRSRQADATNMINITARRINSIQEQKNVHFSKKQSKLESKLIDNQQWSFKYTPRSIDELKQTLDKKKVDQVCELLSNAISGLGPRLIILHGPTGSGKSTLANLASAELGYRVRSWEEESAQLSTYDASGPNDFYLPYERQVDRFARFLVNCCYPSLTFMRTTEERSERGTVVILESLPKSSNNSSSSISSPYEDAQMKMTECLSRLSRNQTLRSCIVYILTVDGDSGATPAQLLEAVGQTNLYFASTINFNPIPAGRMMKTVRSVAQKEGILLDANLQFDGDIRHALNSLQFLSITSECSPSRQKVQSRKTKPTPVTQRDQSYELCHAVGKLIRGRKQGETELGFVPEDVARMCSLDARSLSAFVHENFSKYANAAECDIAAYVEMADTLSSVDVILSSKWHGLDRSGGEDEKDAADLFAESIIARSASCWQKYATPTTSFRRTTITKPQSYDMNREAIVTTKRLESYLRPRGDISSAERFLRDVLPFSTKITTSHDEFHGFTIYQGLQDSSTSAKLLYRKPLNDDIDIIDEMLYLEEPIEEF